MAVPAALLGWFSAGISLAEDEWLLATHRWLGTSTAIWILVLLGIRGRTRQGTYRAALFGGAALVAVTGFFGGALVHGLDHYAW